MVSDMADALPPAGPRERERLILASRSAARRAMLENAGVAFEVRTADVDEDAIKAVSGDLDAAALAVRLAEAKALAVSRHAPAAWVLGSDQTLAFDGGLVSKAASLEAARERLKTLRGRTHQLHSGAALAVPLVRMACALHNRMATFEEAAVTDRGAGQ